MFCNRPLDLSRIDVIVEEWNTFRLWNSAHRQQHLRNKEKKQELRPNLPKPIVPGMSVNVLTLLFSFCSYTSVLLFLLTEVCQPTMWFLCFKAQPGKGLGLSPASE